jgi:hypothetical protein
MSSSSPRMVSFVVLSSLSCADVCGRASDGACGVLGCGVSYIGRVATPCCSCELVRCGRGAASVPSVRRVATPGCSCELVCCGCGAASVPSVRRVATPGCSCELVFASSLPACAASSESERFLGVRSAACASDSLRSGRSCGGLIGGACVGGDACMLGAGVPVMSGCISPCGVCARISLGSICSEV